MYNSTANKTLTLLAALTSITASGARLAMAAPSTATSSEAKSTEKATVKISKAKDSAANRHATGKDSASKKSVKESATSKNRTGKESASSKNTTGKDSATEKDRKPVSAVSITNLSGTWNIKFHEGATTKTHIMAVKVTQQNAALSATGVDEYGDVILDGAVTPPNKISFKRTYKGAQVNPVAQYDGTFTPATVLTPVIAKGKWSAQQFADKSLKPKASANSGLGGEYFHRSSYQ